MILEITKKRVKVSGFTSSLGQPITVPIVHAAVGYDCPYSGKTYMLIIFNALYFCEMENNLIPPFLMRLNGLIVDECPKFLANQPTLNNHSITFPEQSIQLPFMMDGTISYLPTRKPDDKELQTCQHLHLTPDMPDWNPHTEIYKDQEDSMLDYKGDLRARQQSDAQAYISSVNQSVSTVCTDPNIFANQLCDSFPTDDLFRAVSGVQSTRSEGVTPMELAGRWNIGLDTAKRTLQATTQLCTRSTNPTLSRRFSANDRMLRYPRVSTDVFMDTFFASKKSGKSFRGFTCCQIFASPFGHVLAVPLESKAGANIAFAMKRYFKEVGVPPDIIADGAREQVQGAALRLSHQVGCQIKELEKGTPDANRAERYIQTLKVATKRDMVQANSPMILWCFCIEYRVAIMNSCAQHNFLLQRQTPHSKMTGRPTDISHLCQFSWYEWVLYRREGTSYPFPEERLGRCLGPCKNAGNAMSQHVLIREMQVLPLATIRRLTPAEHNSPGIIRRKAEFDEAVFKKMGDSLHPPVEESIPSDYTPYHDMNDKTETMPEADDIPDYDLYLQAEVMLPQNGEQMRAAKVVSRAKDKHGQVLGAHNPQPVLDTRVYDVMFPDGTTQQYAANIIAEHMYSQVDEDGHRQLMIESIINHRKDQTAIPLDEAFTFSANGKKSRKKTTKGWYFHVQWTDGSQSWLPLKEMKESYPVQLAEYSEAATILHEPAIAWWAPHTLKKRNRIIAAVKARVKKMTHKYGIEVPKTVKEAYALDLKNGNTLWRDAIRKEMTNNRVAFQVLEPGESPSSQHRFVECHMIFDVKMDFTRKARFVANGAKTPTPKESCYAGVVSRETVRIALTHAALMGVDVIAGDIMNAYLQAPTKEKYWTICGPEFGSEEEGRKAIIARALYGMKSSGRDFRNHLRDCMEHLGYTSCLADPDLWLRRAKMDSGEDYYEYVLLYVDDCLVISQHARAALEEINKYFPFKPTSIGPPKIYLGAKISKIQLPNGVEAYAASTSQYIQNAVKNIEQHLKARGMSLNRGGETPMSSTYRPELDISPELDSADAAYYQSLIGVLRWTVEMGRIDVVTEASMMSSFVSMPREGHLTQVLSIFAYLKRYHNARIVFDPSYPEIDRDMFERRQWSSIYGEDLKEDIPLNAPEPLGLEFLMRAYIDADHAGDKLTRRSRSGLLVFLNSAPMYWMSKKQTTVETSSFGSEFMAMKHGTEYLRGLRYKLRMMGIPVNNPVFIYGDNQSVLWNTIVPDSTLKKKSNSIAYHFVREGVARDEWRTAYVNTKDNPSDIATKVLPKGEDRRNKIRMLMYDIYPTEAEKAGD